LFEAVSVTTFAEGQVRGGGGGEKYRERWGLGGKRSGSSNNTFFGESISRTQERSERGESFASAELGGNEDGRPE